jgi:GntR family transcriptional regulator, transcriptional repressor for pyruvate dehydrogenase complex
MAEPMVTDEPSGRPTGRVEQLADLLLGQIVDGRYPPGAALPPERELAAQLNANRTTVRQALGRLSQMGVVAAHQGRGTVVLDIDQGTDPDLVARLLERHGPALIAELLEVREALGSLVVHLATERATGTDLDALERALSAVEAAADPSARQAAELGYFAHLVDATHNRPLRTLLRWVEQAYGRSGRSFTAAFADGPSIVAGLRRITDAVRTGEPAAAQVAMSDYTMASAARMLDAIGGAEQSPTPG